MQSLVIRSLKRWWQADPGTNGAALAYYALFSLAPLFIILAVALGGVFGRQAVEARLVHALQIAVGSDVSTLVQTLINYAARPVAGTIATIISAVVTLIGSLALFNQLERALATIWRSDKDLVVATTFWRTRILAIIMILILGILIIISFISSSVATFLTTRTSFHIQLIINLVNYSSAAMSYLYMFILFVCMYKYLPGKVVSWKAAISGALVGGIFFIIGRYLLGLYITHSVIFSAYGAIGAAVLILVWFYYSAQSIFFGGAVSYAIDETVILRQTSL